MQNNLQSKNPKKMIQGWTFISLYIYLYKYYELLVRLRSFHGAEILYVYTNTNTTQTQTYFDNYWRSSDGTDESEDGPTYDNYRDNKLSSSISFPGRTYHEGKWETHC